MKPAQAPVYDDSGSGDVLLEAPQPPPVAASKPPAAVKLHTKEKPVPASVNTDRRFVVVEGAPSTYKPTVMSLPMGMPKPKPTADAPAASKLPATDLQRGDLVRKGVPLSSYLYRVSLRHIEELSSYDSSLNVLRGASAVLNI
jgi:hypothetical protein